MKAQNKTSLNVMIFCYTIKSLYKNQFSYKRNLRPHCSTHTQTFNPTLTSDFNLRNRYSTRINCVMSLLTEAQQHWKVDSNKRIDFRRKQSMLRERERLTTILQNESYTVRSAGEVMPELLLDVMLDLASWKSASSNLSFSSKHVGV